MKNHTRLNFRKSEGKSILFKDLRANMQLWLLGGQRVDNWEINLPLLVSMGVSVQFQGVLGVNS